MKKLDTVYLSEGDSIKVEVYWPDRESAWPEHNDPALTINLSANDDEIVAQVQMLEDLVVELKDHIAKALKEEPQP